MLKYLLNRHKLLFIGLLIAVFTLYFFERFTHSEKKINIKKVEQKLHEKELKCKSIADTIVRLIDYSDSLNGLLSDKFFLPSNIENLTNQNFSIFVYYKNKLVFWSDNILEISDLYNPNEILTPCQLLSNHWVLNEKRVLNDYIVYVFYRIKAEYPKKNKYLIEEFDKDLNIPNNYKISLIPLSYGIDIKNSNNEYIFSIIPQASMYAMRNPSIVVFLLFLVALVVLLLYFDTYILENIKRKISFVNIFLLILIVSVLRFLQSYFAYPKLLYNTEIYNVLVLPNSYIFRTLGDTIVNLTILFWFLSIYKRIISKILLEKERIASSTGWLLSFIEFLVVFASLFFVSEVIRKSTVDIIFTDISQIDVSIVFLLLAVIFVIFTIFYTLYYYLRIFYKKGIKDLIVNSLLGAISAYLVVYFVIGYVAVVQVLIVLLIASTFVLYLYRLKTYKVYYFGIILILITLLSSYTIISAMKQKLNDYFSNLAENITMQSDPITESLLQDIVPKLDQDQTLLTYAQNPNLQNIENEILNYLRRRYFKDYFNKYDVFVDFCTNGKDTLKSIIYCNSLYSSKLSNSTFIIPNKLFLINQPNSVSQYLIVQTFEQKDNVYALLYITLQPKLYPTKLGYPELLLDEHTFTQNLNDISYAKYQNNKLVYYRGNYNYPLIFDFNSNNYSLKNNDLEHYVFKENDDAVVVITYKPIDWFVQLVIFSYLFVLYSFIVLLYLIVRSFPKVVNLKRWNFRTKLTVTLASVVTLFLAFWGAINIYLNIKQYNKKFYDEAYYKIEQINTYVQQLAVEGYDLFKSSDTLNYKLRQIAEIFNNDVNIYDYNGFLIGSSRPEIYNLNLISKKISYQALGKYKFYKIPQFILNEQIGKLKYLSVYRFFTLPKNNQTLIINLPYFTRPNEIRNEIFKVITTIINIYVVLLAFILILSVLISEQIISPLKFLQNKIQKLDLRKGYEKIEYDRDDEVGQLVDEYNKMVDKLHEYIEILSKSERESAWRDMARQIAHEIKNPLTPMKLSIQLLTKSWENQDADFDTRLREVSRTLINQIETLRRIAEEFSEFAKLPKPQETVFNMVEKIEEICKLFENVENVDVYANLRDIKTALVYADDKQMTRALINLVKNAIQAIPEGIKGKVIIDLDVYGSKIQIKVIDNGSGIPDEIKDKLFVPSFTTKSSGMGLGLAMVKTIIDNAHGKISFKSELGKGTTFIIELPLYKPTE